MAFLLCLECNAGSTFITVFEETVFSPVRNAYTVSITLTPHRFRSFWFGKRVRHHKADGQAEDEEEGKELHASTI